MTQAALRHAAMWRRAESLRQRTITIVVLDDEFAGALAYALQRALEEPAAVRAVRVRPTKKRTGVQPPIAVRTLTGYAPEAFTQVSAQSDLLVVQSPPAESEHVTDLLLTDLRRHAQCALIEVDEDAQIVRISGASRWSYVARGVSVQVGTDQASRVPPPGA